MASAISAAPRFSARVNRRIGGHINQRIPAKAHRRSTCMQVLRSAGLSGDQSGSATAYRRPGFQRRTDERAEPKFFVQDCCYRRWNLRDSGFCSPRRQPHERFLFSGPRTRAAVPPGASGRRYNRADRFQKDRVRFGLFYGEEVFLLLIFFPLFNVI